MHPFPAPAATLLLAVFSCPGVVAQEPGGEANGLVVRLTIEEAAAEPPYTAVLVGPAGSVEVPLKDDGEASDAQAGDGSWCGSAWADGDSFQVSLTTAGGTVAGGEVSWAPGAKNRDVVLKLAPGGLTATGEVAEPFVPRDDAAPGAPSGKGGAGASLGFNGLGLPLAGALALLVCALWLGSFVRGFRESRALRALLPTRPPEVRGIATLPPEDSVHQPVGATPTALVEHLVTDLARSGPVVVIAPRAETFPGFPPGPIFRFDGPPGLLARALHAVSRRSVVPPSLVALVDPPDARRIEDLAQNLPDSVRALFVVGAQVSLQDVPRFLWSQGQEGWRAEPAGPEGTADDRP